MKYIVTVILLLLVFTSCYYDNVDEMNPEAGLVPDCDPDTSAVTYNNYIKNLMFSDCGSDNSGCHQSGNTISNVSLATYDDVTAVASTGQLLGSITHDPNYKPMPQNADKLSDCKINKVTAWINQGLVQ